MEDIVKGAKSIEAKPLKVREIFCDGFKYPKAPFKKTSEMIGVTQ